MCGIIGYIGKKEPTKFLLQGLKKLEYRGYDSSGIALKGKTIQIIKTKGRIKDLEEKTNNTDLIDASIGIAHTRWATNGESTTINAHPHEVGNVVIVHNGIIENAKSIKENLVGVDLKSTTDTEVAAAIINKYYEGDPLQAINKAISEFVGSYAFGIIFKDQNKLYAVRKASPLVIGIGNSENYIASDITALREYTNKFIFLDEEEVAVLTSNDISIYKGNIEIQKDITVLDTNYEETQLSNYKHYMLKEIMEEPSLLKKQITYYIENKDKIFDITPYKEIHIVACGSAMYAGLIGKRLFEETSHIKTTVSVASEYRYENTIYSDKTLVILISQSGETADTIACLKKAKENKIETLGIVNNETSTIARESTNTMYIKAGEEIAVATTKAYLLQVLTLIFIALKASTKKNLEKDDKEILEEAKKIPSELEKILKDTAKIKEIAEAIYKSHDVFYIGRGLDYDLSLEGSLKLKEVSYIHSEAYPAGELKHGTISLIEDGTIVIAIETQDIVRDKTEANVEETIARGAKVITITNDETTPNHYLRYVVPKTNIYMTPLLVAPILQLIGYYVGDLKGLDIDKPRNLAKSVTVE